MTDRLSNLQGIRDFLSYDRDTGRFGWIKRPLGLKVWHVGIEAGCVRADGHRLINWKGKPYLAHHLVWWFETGDLPKILDHEDRQPSNNRFKNLRPCNQSQNMANANKRKVGSSQYRGVRKHIKGGWIVGLCGSYLGYFKDEAEAARAYDRAATAKFGEFANINFKEAL